MNRGGPGWHPIGVGGFPQAVFADIRGLETASFLSTVAKGPLSARALIRRSSYLTPNVTGCLAVPPPPRPAAIHGTGFIGCLLWFLARAEIFIFQKPPQGTPGVLEKGKRSVV
jgi:hypothetical protein